MKIEVLGSLEEKKLKKLIEENGLLANDEENFKNRLQEIESERRAQIVSTAASLSRFKGTVFEILEKRENKTFNQNVNMIKSVIGMGHDSIADHDYLVFAIQDVTPVIEQTIIAERFSSFTIKSRREVDFSTVGYYTPDFHDMYGNVLENNKDIKEEYNEYMKSLFNSYSELVNLGIPMEDSRFVLPYCYYSNIVMGVDAHTLKDMIIKYTKTKLSNIQEIKEFGQYLYDIAMKICPYIISEIDKEEYQKHDKIFELLDENLNQKIGNSVNHYEILDSSRLMNYTENIDDTIIISSIMRRYQFNYDRAKKIIEAMDKETKISIIRKIAFESDQLELTQVNFEFQIPLSFAVLTHLTRHRTHHIMVPDFVPNVDLSKYKIPPTVKNICEDKFKGIFEKNIKMYNHFKYDYGICEEDLVYFTLSGNMVNVLTNMDGKTLKHIIGLRECNKAQWETRKMAYDMHKEIDKIPNAEIYSSILGATCTTQGYCKEGKESCGKIKSLKK